MLFCSKSNKIKYYTIPQIDLSKKPRGIDSRFDSLFRVSTVDDSKAYLGHPDSILLNNGDILTFYPEGHGKGKIIAKRSTDGGVTYADGLKNMPASWENSLETPTVFRLRFKDGGEKLILISGNPKWPSTPTPLGFNCSVSCDDGETWSEFERFFDRESSFPVCPVVSMASLIHLKENGEFVDKWMGIFHDRRFVNYKTILTFNNGKMQWSKPEKYLSEYRKTERCMGVCEVCAIRSDGGKGDRICLIARANKKRSNSVLFISDDEGKHWSKPQFLPTALCGERHKAVYLPDGRLYITFRSIILSKDEVIKQRENYGEHNWYSEGLVAWVGTFDDIVNLREGQYRIKLAHTYLPKQNEPSLAANADTGYCGNVLLPDGTVVTSSYGIFFTDEKEHGTYSTDKGQQKRKTCVVSKRVNIKDTDELLKNILG